MRDAIVRRLVQRAAVDPALVFLTGDLGFSVVEPLAEVLGERFVNAGIAEANMMSMAGGLAAQGLHPWAYSIAPFATVRCLEQIRNDVCYERRAVRIIGIGGGYSYGTLGPTHHALEDASLVAALPGIVVATPSTTAELDRLFDLLVDDPRPSYWRADRENGPDRPAPAFGLDDVVPYRDGDDVLLVTSGSILSNVLGAADALATVGVEARVVSVPVVAPFPVEALVEAAGSRPILAVFEGFDGNPLEVGAMRAALRCGSRFAGATAGLAFARSVGNTGHLRAAAGLDVDGLVRRARELIGR